MNSQEILRNVGDRARRLGNSMRSSGGSTDSLRHRDKNEDSITINFRYLDSTRLYSLDTSVVDFTTRFPIPSTHIYLGNTGNATRSLLFSPNMQPGFDPGFHAFDAYTWKLEKVRFFNTTRPYSEINYLLGTRVEQIIELLHTQNINPQWNFSFAYRLINSPGFFKNQNTNHNNYLLNSWFQTKNRRYNNYFVLLRNKLQSAENGGIQDTADFLENPVYKDRFNIPTKLGGDNAYSTNFFSSKIKTGNFYGDFIVMMRQQFDIGRKDSLVSDSTVIPLFFPKLRLEHSFTYISRQYEFRDLAADSAYYKNYYDSTISSATDTFQLKDEWHEYVNDFSLYQYPDEKNLQQFIRLGVTLQNIHGVFLSRGSANFYNLSGHAEYRNWTRNQRWDIEANGKIYFTGLNNGDFQAALMLQGFAGNKIGYISMGFENVNRTPSFITDPRSSFYLKHVRESFNHENTTHLYVSYFLPSFAFRLSGHYYLLTNYTYLERYINWKQESSLFNILQIAVEKTISFSKRWKWRAELYFQQPVGSAPVHVPAIYSRNRIGYEGKLGFRNLDIAFGAEIKYRSPYKADNYSPLLGQFFYQDSIQISNKLPDISGYVHFRIRSFKAFVRAENLNTARTLGGFNFTNNNKVAPGYALPGLQIRVGIYWGFIN